MLPSTTTKTKDETIAQIIKFKVKASSRTRNATEFQLLLFPSFWPLVPSFAVQYASNFGIILFFVMIHSKMCTFFHCSISIEEKKNAKQFFELKRKKNRIKFRTCVDVMKKWNLKSVKRWTIRSIARSITKSALRVQYGMCARYILKWLSSCSKTYKTVNVWKSLKHLTQNTH